MTFGEKLQELRRKNAISQDVLAEKLEVSRQAVSKWERDEAMPETDKIVRIARLFQVSTDYLLLAEEKEEPKEQPRQERVYQPAAQPYKNNGQRMERFVRRHGYKAGYIMMGAGALLCIVALLIFMLLPKLGQGFFDPAKNFSDSMGDVSWGSGITEQLPGIVEDEAIGQMPGFGGVLDGGFDIAVDSMEQTWVNSLRIMAGFVGTPILLAGIGPIILGAVIVRKGKKLAKTGPEL